MQNTRRVVSAPHRFSSSGYADRYARCCDCRYRIRCPNRQDPLASPQHIRAVFGMVRAHFCPASTRVRSSTRPPDSAALSGNGCVARHYLDDLGKAAPRFALAVTAPLFFAAHKPPHPPASNNVLGSYAIPARTAVANGPVPAPHTARCDRAIEEVAMQIHPAPHELIKPLIFSGPLRFLAR